MKKFFRKYFNKSPFWADAYNVHNKQPVKIRDLLKFSIL